MYYIQSTARNDLTQMCKRLKDFKGTEGRRYLVRKRKSITMFDFIPVYEVVDGKLKPTNEQHGLWL